MALGIHNVFQEGPLNNLHKYNILGYIFILRVDSCVYSLIWYSDWQYLNAKDYWILELSMPFPAVSFGWANFQWLID